MMHTSPATGASGHSSAHPPPDGQSADAVEVKLDYESLDSLEAGSADSGHLSSASMEISMTDEAEPGLAPAHPLAYPGQYTAGVRQSERQVERRRSERGDSQKRVDEEEEEGGDDDDDDDDDNDDDGDGEGESEGDGDVDGDGDGDGEGVEESLGEDEY
ncbi:unnamed protein product, partial [Protopolystoma xenopodis]